MSKKPTEKPRGLEVKPPTPGEPGVKPETQTPEAGGVKLEKVNSLQEVLQKQNSRYTYAIVRARRDVVISVINRKGFLKVNINTMIDRRAISGFDARLLGRVIRALNDLYNDLTTLNPDLNKEKKSVREY